MDFVAREPFFGVCTITGATIVGFLFRPMRLPEAVWACLGALALILLHLISWDHTLLAVTKGIDVYLFLAGMMLLAELARWEGVFNWLASWAVRAANKSASRLFLLIYCVGTIVTVFLSNDATAVVLTPAVYAAVRKAKVDALPYLLACAFIANAASFVLPISNPANIVVFDGHLPPLLRWMRTFLIPSIVSIIVTFFVLRFASRKHLREQAAEAEEPVALSEAGKLAAWGLVIATVILLAASITGISLGLPTCMGAVTAIIIVALKDRQAPISVVREVSWSVIPLVAGLFVIVEALKDAGTLQIAQTAFEVVSRWPVFRGDLTGAFCHPTHAAERLGEGHGKERERSIGDRGGRLWVRSAGGTQGKDFRAFCFFPPRTAREEERIMFSSSRTFPGQECSESSFAADAPSDLAGEAERSKNN